MSVNATVGKSLIASLAIAAVVCFAATSYAESITPGRTPFSNEWPAGPRVGSEAGAAAQPAQAPDRVSVLVHLQPNVDRGPVRGFAAAQGAFVKYEYDILPDLINIRNLPQNALNALLATPGVVRWEPDREVRAHMNDSTPLIRALQSQISGAGLSANGAGVRVCIIDTGIDSDSAMYSDRIDAAAGRDFVNDDNNPEDDAGHGSHVAGTAVGGDSLSVNFGCVGSEPFHGIAPEATLIGIKVLNASGSGSFSDVIAGINYGANQTASGGRCDVINMSLGGGAFSGTCDAGTGGRLEPRGQIRRRTRRERGHERVARQRADGLDVRVHHDHLQVAGGSVGLGPDRCGARRQGVDAAADAHRHDVGVAR